MREREIEGYLVDRVKDAGGEVRKVRWIGRTGAPDRVVFLPGVLAWVELKAPGKAAKPHQEREHRRMRALGQMVYVVDSMRGVDALVSNLLLLSQIRGVL